MNNIKNIILSLTQSSEDPTKISATLTGILIGIASYLHQYASFVPFINNFFNSELGHQLDPILTAIGMIVGSIWFLFGLFRKLSNKVDSKISE